jgi:hypothetical protein
MAMNVIRLMEMFQVDALSQPRHNLGL